MSITLKRKNFSVSKLRYSLTAVGTELTVTFGDGPKFPQDGPFRAVIWNQAYASPHLDPNREIVTAQLSTGDIFSIIRAVESTVASAWKAGDSIIHDITAGTLDEFASTIGLGDTDKIDNTAANQTGAGWKTIKTYTLTGGSLSTKNALYIRAILRRTTGTGGVTVRLTYGAAVIATLPAIITSSSVVIQGCVVGAGATNAQRGYIYILGADDIGTGTSAINSTANQAITIDIDLETDGDQWDCDFFEHKEILGV